MFRFQSTVIIVDRMKLQHGNCSIINASECFSKNTYHRKALSVWLKCINDHILTRHNTLNKYKMYLPKNWQTDMAVFCLQKRIQRKNHRTSNRKPKKNFRKRRPVTNERSTGFDYSARRTKEI